MVSSPFRFESAGGPFEALRVSEIAEGLRRAHRRFRFLALAKHQAGRAPGRVFFTWIEANGLHLFACGSWRNPYASPRARPGYCGGVLAGTVEAVEF